MAPPEDGAAPPPSRLASGPSHVMREAMGSLGCHIPRPPNEGKCAMADWIRGLIAAAAAVIAASATAQAAGETTGDLGPLDLTGHPLGLIALALFILAYIL